MVYAHESDNDATDDSFITDDDSFIVGVDDADSFSDGDNEESEEDTTDEPTCAQSSVSAAETDENVKELLQEASHICATPAPGGGLRRSGRKRQAPTTYEEEYWGAAEKSLFLQDISTEELQNYLDHDADDPEILSGEEELESEEDDEEEVEITDNK